MIEVSHLTKCYGDHTAVSDLSFTIEDGQIYGFLGSNGAGKSTTMNIMTGCLAATSGEVKIGGCDIFEDAKKAKSLIGYLPEQPPVYLDSTPKEYLRFVAEVKKIPRAEREWEIKRVMELTGITEMQNRLIKHLSKGYRQRVGIAQALLGDPEVIILDEPTVGLDPMQIKEIRDLIVSLRGDHTVILSSHILSEVQAVCQKILIISGGKLVACDTPDHLEELFAGRSKLDLVAEATFEEVEAVLDGVEAELISEENGKTHVQIDLGDMDGELLSRRLFMAFGQAGKFILSMNVVKVNLEDVFMELAASDGGEAQTDEKDTCGEVEE